MIDDKLKCANPNCEADAGDGPRCPRCGEAQYRCRRCGATTRALARFCRACAGPLINDWALEHPGLRYRPARNFGTGGALKLEWQMTLGFEVVAAPLAARGLLILTSADGHVILLDECDGRVRAELKAAPPVHFTPVITDNLLVVASGEGVVAFDMIAALYGGVARGGLKAWQTGLDGQVARPLLAATDKVLALVHEAAGATLVMLERKTGAPARRLKLAGRAEKAATYLKEKYLFIAARDGTIMLIDVARAELCAVARAGRELDTNVLPTGRAEGALFALTDGQLWGASPVGENRLQLQPFSDTGGLIVNAISATDRYVAIAHGSGLALCDSFGAQLWETALDANSIVAAPLIEGENIWVVDDSGMMFYFTLPASVPRLRQRVFEQGMALPTILTSERLIFASRAGEIKVYRWR